MCKTSVEWLKGTAGACPVFWMNHLVCAFGGKYAGVDHIEKKCASAQPDEPKQVETRGSSSFGPND